MRTLNSLLRYFTSHFKLLSLVILIACGGDDDDDDETLSLFEGEFNLQITYLGNDGVHITDGTSSVIVDALPGNLSGWRSIAEGVQSNIETGSGDFAGISVAMVTHNHGDHVSSTSVNAFLSGNPSARLIAPPGVRGSISSAGQIVSTNPGRGEFDDVEVDGISIRVMHMTHFDAFGNDFSDVDNYTYLIELGGFKILHLGDFAYSSANLEPFDLPAQDIDVVLIPALSPFLNGPSKSVVEENIAADMVIALHLQSSTSAPMVNAVYPDAEVFTTSLDFIRL